MKKRILSLLLLATGILPTAVLAQQPPSPDFEGTSTWVNQNFGLGSYDEPLGWGTTNSLILLALAESATPGPVTVFKETGSVHAGSNAMKIVSAKNYNPSYLAVNLNDTSGFAFVGKVQPAAPYIVSGYPMTTQYAAFEFYAKYTPSGTDNGLCLVLFQKRNGTKLDTIAFGATLINSSSTYTKYTINMAYKSTVLPDTASILFSACGTDKPQVGSVLYVDDIAFTGSVAGLNERNMLMNRLEVYPNPATDRVNFQSIVKGQEFSYIEVYDATGKKVTAQNALSNFTSLSLEGMANGFYSYTAYNSKNELIGIGKFNVSK